MALRNNRFHIRYRIT